MVDNQDYFPLFPEEFGGKSRCWDLSDRRRKMVRHVIGRIHEGIEKFCPFNGLQCIVIAVLALVILSGMSRDRPQTWVNNVISSNIGSLVNEGTSLYAYISRVRGFSGYLSHNDLPRSLRD